MSIRTGDHCILIVSCSDNDIWKFFWKCYYFRHLTSNFIFSLITSFCRPTSHGFHSLLANPGFMKIPKNYFSCTGRSLGPPGSLTTEAFVDAMAIVVLAGELFEVCSFLYVLLVVVNRYSQLSSLHDHSVRLSQNNSFLCSSSNLSKWASNCDRYPQSCGNWQLHQLSLLTRNLHNIESGRIWKSVYADKCWGQFTLRMSLTASPTSPCSFLDSMLVRCCRRFDTEWESLEANRWSS